MRGRDDAGLSGLSGLAGGSPGLSASALARAAARRFAAVGLSLTLALGLAGAGCGGPGQVLDGSLGEYYDLSFTEVDAVLFSSELAIQFVDDDGEKVAVVTVKVLQAQLDGPATVDLARFGNVTGTSGGRPMPALVGGTLVLNAYAPEEGAAVTGSFDAELSGERGTLTVHGEFDTTLALAR